MSLDTFFIFVFGFCFGSFLNVLIYRLPRSLPITGRSFCPKCRKKIAWYDNIPLVSFILLGGRCRHCHALISWQYPIVELTTGILTLFTVYSLQFIVYNMLSLFTVGCLLFVVYCLIVIFVIDLQHEIIPDQIIYPAIAISLIFSLYPYLLISNLLSALVASGFFYLLYWLTHGKGMGFGDVKLAGLMGLFLGFPQIIVALYLAFLTGGVIGALLLLTGRKKLHSHLPFGPFLVGATILSLFFGEALWQKLIPALLQ